jgi:hypothetical protein
MRAAPAVAAARVEIPQQQQPEKGTNGTKANASTAATRYLLLLITEMRILFMAAK